MTIIKIHDVKIGIENHAVLFTGEKYFLLIIHLRISLIILVPYDSESLIVIID